MKTKRILPVALMLMGLAVLPDCSNNNSAINSNKGDSNLAEMASSDMKTYENSDINAVEQARPSIMVIPGDQTLQKFKMLKTENKNGREYVIRNYQGYLLKDSNAKLIISSIQNAFVQQGYPLNDFEQTLKQLDTQEALDMADGLEKDAKTMLLTAARPDIILELNYFHGNNKNLAIGSHDYSKDDDSDDNSVNYTLNAIDAYSNKVVSTISATELKGNSIVKTMQSDLDKKLPKLKNEIVGYFSDILKRGRDITVRIAVEKGCEIKLSDESIEGDSYADWIIDYIKSHTVKGAYTMQRNTDRELSFVNCRIKLLNDDGTQYGVYDWARDLQKNLRTNLGVKVTNKSQGLGEVLLVIEGLKNNNNETSNQE
jgi:hypothetical protein